MTIKRDERKKERKREGKARLVVSVLLFFFQDTPREKGRRLERLWRNLETFQGSRPPAVDPCLGGGRGSMSAFRTSTVHGAYL